MQQCCKLSAFWESQGSLLLQNHKQKLQYINRGCYKSAPCQFMAVAPILTTLN